jgi:hypothetical protein
VDKEQRLGPLGRLAGQPLLARKRRVRAGVLPVHRCLCGESASVVCSTDGGCGAAPDRTGHTTAPTTQAWCDVLEQILHRNIEAGGDTSIQLRRHGAHLRAGADVSSLLPEALASASYKGYELLGSSFHEAGSLSNQQEMAENP